MKEERQQRWMRRKANKTHRSGKPKWHGGNIRYRRGSKSGWNPMGRARASSAWKY